MYDDDDLDPSEYPDGDDLDDPYNDDNDNEDDGADRTCPACHEPVYYDAKKCPHCGEWIIQFGPDTFGTKRPKWIVPVARVVMIMIILGLLISLLGLLR
jgi:hypothetical protein